MWRYLLFLILFYFFIEKLQMWIISAYHLQFQLAIITDWASVKHTDTEKLTTLWYQSGLNKSKYKIVVHLTVDLEWNETVVLICMHSADCCRSQTPPQTWGQPIAQFTHFPNFLKRFIWICHLEIICSCFIKCSTVYNITWRISLTGQFWRLICQIMQEMFKQLRIQGIFT